MQAALCQKSGKEANPCQPHGWVVWGVDVVKPSEFHKKFFEEKTPEHDKLLGECIHNWRWLTIELGGELFLKSLGEKIPWEANFDIPDKVSYEIEVPCMIGNFIVGYADLLFKIPVVYFMSDEDHRRTVKLYVVVEVKPKLRSITSALRQVKTYKELLDADYGIIATYSKIDGRFREILKNEDVLVATFPYDEEKKEEQRKLPLYEERESKFKQLCRTLNIDTDQALRVLLKIWKERVEGKK